MGFCRRCGDIVHERICKCGGVSVAGVVRVAHEKERTPSPDRWSQTYTRSESPKKASHTWGPVKAVHQAHTASGGSPVRRITALSTVGVFSTILSPHSQPPSPLKQSLLIEDDEGEVCLPPDHEASNESPDNQEVALSKVFGTVLQSADASSKYSCAICREAFIPDATIYPSPCQPEASEDYLCRPCFVLNGGSKGTCASCGNPVLTLKSEGQYVKYDGRYWHNSCFRCRGCFMDLGCQPMVDLLGTPCCVDCFDISSTRRPSISKSTLTTHHNSENRMGNASPAAYAEPTGESPHSSAYSVTLKMGERRPSSSRMSPANTPTKSPKPFTGSPMRESRKQSATYRSTNDENNPVGQDGPDRARNGIDARGKSPCVKRDVFGPVEMNSQPSVTESSQMASTLDESCNTERTSRPRFGASSSCPGCHIAVSIMEKGVVQGPNNSRWHASCLVCGGKYPADDLQGCRKKLDSAAKADKQGRIWCRNCLNDLPKDMRPSPQTSPSRPGALTPLHTGSIFASCKSSYPRKAFLPGDEATSCDSSQAKSDEQEYPFSISPRRVAGKIAKLAQQLTGDCKTISADIGTKTGPYAVQSGTFPVVLTGTYRTRDPPRPLSPTKGTPLENLIEEEAGVIQHATGGSIALVRQMTGGGLSPTRQLSGRPPSPVKPRIARPRPRSVLGMRHGMSKSIDEKNGRGMFLVGQMTGNGRIES